MTINAIKFDRLGEAMQHLNADPHVDAVVSIDRLAGYFAVKQAEVNRLDMSRVSFARFFDHEMPDGTIRAMSVPHN